MKILVAFVIAASFVAQMAEQEPQPIVVVTASVGIN